MAITNGNRKIIDLKRWEFCSPSPQLAGTGVFIVSSNNYKQQQLLVTTATVQYIYNPEEDGFIQIPSGGLAGTFGAGACGVAGAFSTGATAGVAALTATGGTSNTIITNQTLARDLKGFSLHVTGGPAAGDVKTIASNTIGANATITIEGTFSASPTASTTYRLIAPTWYILNSGTVAANIFKRYDFATNSWVALSTTGLPATIGTDCRLVATPSWIGSSFVAFATGTATSATSTTLTNSAKAWTVNQWSNYQVRITAGTGLGQVRAITSNTATALTVPTWTVTPDATSQYVIEGNDDYLYLVGNGAVTLYRYSISGNTWSTITPTAARAGAPGAGVSAHWIYAANDSNWSSESNIKNGRFLYSFRGGAGAVLDYYDIALNTWVSASTYAPATETFTAGTTYVSTGEYLYIQKDNTGRWFRFDPSRSAMEPWSTMIYTQGGAVVGDKAFDVTYTEGGNTIRYIYMILNTSTVMLRSMVI